MKTLLLLRHGKAELAAPSGDDHDRALRKSGRSDVRAVAELAADGDWVPRSILSSTARRARETALEFADHSGWAEGSLRLEPALYGADPEQILAQVRALDDAEEMVLLVGHNPGLEETVQLLTGFATRLQTGALAAIRLETSSWSGVDPATRGKLVALLRAP